MKFKSNSELKTEASNIQTSFSIATLSIKKMEIILITIGLTETQMNLFKNEKIIEIIVKPKWKQKLCRHHMHCQN